MCATFKAGNRPSGADRSAGDVNAMGCEEIFCRNFLMHLFNGDRHIVHCDTVPNKTKDILDTVQIEKIC